MPENMNSQWSELERAFSSERDQFAHKVDLTQYIDDPFLFTKRQRVTDFLTRIELFKKIVSVEGAVVECGVHKGGSLMLYYHLASILEPYGLKRQVLGFDSFEGFPGTSSSDPQILDKDIFADTDYQVLADAIRIHDKNRALPHISRCEVIKGDATQTIPKYKSENPHLVVAMLYLDFDLYEPTKTAIDELLPLVPKGGIVAFDELNTKKWPGETIALKESLNLAQVKLQKFYFDPWPCYFVVGE
ncbi:MAG: dTDP-6-deoxy-L-hexose 3-O-methyltransferase [Acidiferrobacteraceae bacterium]|nr:dTDP-6-deoxy-L-hexose 3-O-methyltransferase [Acidiferrobacteraceae bacterium]|tara:strand:+ start:257 stop:991 length:735 start_codon:yes stop_codon:yes gene_type:complete